MVLKNQNLYKSVKDPIELGTNFLFHYSLSVQDDVNEIEQTASLVIKPKIKAWGETGLVKNNK